MESGNDIEMTKELSDELISIFQVEEIKAWTGVLVGYQKNGKRIIVDMIPTQDPEIDLEDITWLKSSAEAEEDDFYRDLNIIEVLNSVTDEVDYYTWAA